MAFAFFDDFWWPVLFRGELVELSLVDKLELLPMFAPK